MLSYLALAGSSHPLGSYVVPKPCPREEVIHLPLHLCPLLFLGISHLLRLVLQELNLFYSRDVNGVCLLYDLLHSPWLQALLKVSAPLF